MERNFNVDRRFQIFCDKLTSNNVSKDLIIESSYNTIDLSSNTIIFDGHVDLSMVICNNINISNISEIVTKFLRVKTISLPSNVRISYNSVNDGYITNTRVGYNSEGIGRSDAYFTYINVSGGDSSFNNSLYINKNLVVDGTLTISNNLLINGTNFASIETSFNNYKAALEQNFYSTKITTKDVSALNISISNELVVNKTAYINDLTLSGQLLNSVLKVPHIFTIDPSGYDNHSGVLIINGDLTVRGAETTLSSSYVDICDVAIKLASKLENILDLSNTNAGLDISNIASLKYNGSVWNFSGGQLTVDNKKVLFSDDVSLAKRNFDLSINALITDFSSSFFTIKRNIDDSYNDTYNRFQIDNSFILRSNVDLSLTALQSYAISSYISKNQLTTSFQDIITLMDLSYVPRNNKVIPGQPQYDYSTSTITQFGQNISGETTLNYFGYSVALSEDGTIMGITAPFNDGTGTLQGSARIYKYNDVSWVQLGQDIDGEADNDLQTIIKLSKDGTIVALGSWFNSGTGSVRVFKYNNIDISWIQLGQDIDGTGPSDEFGRSISLSDNGKIIAIGAAQNDTSYNNAGQVCVYSYNDISWNKIGTFNGFDASSNTGQSVSLSSTGTIIAISSLPPETSTIIPRVDIYELSNNTWSPKGAIIYGPYTSGNGGSRFGKIIALSSDGTTLAINDRVLQGANYGRALVYKYTSSDNSWNRLGSDISGPAVSRNEDIDPYIALSADGTIMALGYVSDTDYKGLVRLYKFINNKWMKIGTTDLSGDNAQSRFGYSIALSSNGSIMAIGMPTNAPSFTGIVRTYNVNYAYTLTYTNPTIVANSFASSFASFTEKLDISYVLKSVFEASHNNLKTRFDISFATISATNIGASAIIIDTINTKYSSNQRFANTLWNQLGLDISNIGTFGVANKNNKIVISNDGKVAAYSKPYTTFTTTQVETAVSTWTYITVPDATNLCRGVCWSPELGLFVAVGDRGNNRVMTSPNGITWTVRIATSANRWVSVCWSKELGIFVAVSRDIQVMTSSNGITWISRRPVSGAGRSVCWSAELLLFVAVADDSAARSSDGITWITSSGILQGEWVCVCWSPERRLFVAGSVNFARIMTSSDGITWTTGTSAVATSGQWTSVCWSPQLLLFVAVGYAGTYIMTSPDGIVWTGKTGPVYQQWFSVCWSKELGIFVAVAITGSNNRVMTSRDGTTWTARAAGGTDWWYGVCWSGELGIFAAVGSGGTNIVMTSSVATTKYNGIVYVYELSNNNWNQLGTNAILGIPDDELGYSLALSSNGRIVAASSLYKNASSGQVRLFELSNNTNTWIQKGFNINGPRPASESGYSISLAGNGNSIAIGAWKDNSNGTNAGAVRVYDFSASIADWRQRGQTIAGVSGSFEGYETALSLDGQTLASASIVIEPRLLSISGGTMTTVHGHIIHSFTSVGSYTFIPVFSGNVEVLIVGGGGGGGGTGNNGSSGGGGGGGVVYIPSLSVTAGANYPIVIGDGGSSGANGQNSTAFTAIAAGGGRGGLPFPTNGSGSGNNGGSGGGAGGGNITNIGGISSGNSPGTNSNAIIHGNNGGSMTHAVTFDYRGAGGGGAGTQGFNTNTNSTENGGQFGFSSGGDGIMYDILGTNYYWAGGGGGGGRSSIGGWGGRGGGGGGGGAQGSNTGGPGGGTALNSGGPGNVVGSGSVADRGGGAGGANTGGGGGGGSYNNAGGKGGSGIVVIRYLQSDNTTGLVKTFTWSGTTWTPKGTINGPQIYLTDISYDISNTFIPSQGQILGGPFTLSGTTYSNTDYNGYGSALNSDGTIFAISSASSPALGCIRVYKFNGTSWQLMGPIIYGTATNNIIVFYSYILNTLKISYDGRTLATLVSGSTATYGIYRYNDVSWNNTGYLSNGRATTNGPAALSGDGNTFVMSDDTAGSGGIVYAWKYINNVWTTIAAINNTFSPTFSSWTMSLGISYDGNTLVGSSRIYPSNADQQGYARVFKYNGTIWNQLGPVILGPRPIQEFGLAASMSSDGLTISVGGYTDFRVFKYNAIDVSWQQIGVFPVTSGLVAYSYLSGDGTTVATWYSNKAFIWKYRLGSWIKIVESSDGTGMNGNALSADGTVYATCHTSPTYIKIHKLTTTISNIINENLLYSTNKAKYLNLFFGRDIKLSSNGNKIVIGATGPTINSLDLTFNTNYPYNQGYRYNQGSIYVYEYIGSGTTWRQLGQSIHGISGDDEFGSSVSMSNDGTIISAGSNNNVTNSGYVRVFAYANNYWYQVSNAINGKPTTSRVGTHALSGDGTTLIQSNNTYNNAYGINKNLAFVPFATTINSTISGDLVVTGKAMLNSFRISDKHIFDVSINGYSSHYLASSDVSASIVDYYSNVGSTYNRVFKIDACGNVSNYSGIYGAISDSRLKENIVTSSPKLEDLLKIRVVNYNLKGQDTTKYIGVVAQELEELFPELVAETNSDERLKSVNYSSLTIMLIKAFQEQQVLINNLNATLEELEK